MEINNQTTEIQNQEYYYRHARRRRNKRRNKKKPILILIFVLIFILISSYFIFKEKPLKESVYPEEVFGVTVNTSIISEELTSRTKVKRKIKYIVIHETGNTGNGADAKNHSNFLNNGGNGETAWHYTVDDYEIYHHIPDDEIAWHAGDKETKDGGNMCGIGIELCVNPEGDFEKTFDNSAKLTAYLIKSYKLNIKAVKQHGDFMSKNCPQTIRDNGRWQEFIDKVSEYLKK